MGDPRFEERIREHLGAMTWQALQLAFKAELALEAAAQAERTLEQNRERLIELQALLDKLTAIIQPSDVAKEA